MQDNNKEEIVDAIIPVVDKTIDKPSRMFKDLKEGDRPLSPLPPDNMSDIQYPQFIEPRCSLCTSALKVVKNHNQ